MISEKRSQAARANGARSRGPKSPEGKAISSRNALRHGLLSTTLLLPGEDPENFEALFAQLTTHYAPVNDVEMSMIEEMASSYWRLRRVWAMEQEIVHAGMDAHPGNEFQQSVASWGAAVDTGRLAVLYRYEARLHNMYHRARRALESTRNVGQASRPVQAERTSAEPTIPDPPLPNEPKPAFPVMQLVRPLLLCAALLLVQPVRAAVLKAADFRHYIDALNAADDGTTGFIPDAEAAHWMEANVPLLSVPDREVELTYYYRWWALRKHIEKTPAGFVLTEFLRPVHHSTDYNAISCALGLHIAEARWIRDPKYLDDYINFWLHSGENGGLERHYHQFSNWTADALYDRYLANADRARLIAQLDALRKDYAAWEAERLTPSGLFWQRDVSDGMESSISGGRRVKNLRPSINAYMFGNARAIARIAALAGNAAVRDEFESKAAALRKLTMERLWDPESKFFETVREDGKFAGVREEIGFTPWYFDLPEAGKGYEIAWKQLMDPQGFFAPYGPTTAERRHPEFLVDLKDDCQWNGFSWPFATSITLRALANVLHHYTQDAISPADYWRTFQVYTNSQRLKGADGTVLPFVDEDLNPLTGVWQARQLKLRKRTYYGRGDHYNHSSYADLVITGLIGLRPRADDVVEVHPLAPPEWDWFALDRVPYHGHELTILYDRTGAHFKTAPGLHIVSDGRELSVCPPAAHTCSARL